MNSEQIMEAACIMRQAAEANRQAAERVEEAVWKMSVIFDAGYGGVAPRLLEELTKLELEGVKPC